MDALLPTVAIPSEVEPRRIEGPQSSGQASFSGELSRAFESVDSLQKAADVQGEAVAAGQGNLHEAAIALQKADVSMRLLVNIRNKVVSAYQDIMRMAI